MANVLVLALLLLSISWFPIYLSSQSDIVTLSNLHYSKTTLVPYAWRYIRVDLPTGFARMSLHIQTDVDIDARTIQRTLKSKLPLICFRNGSPPLPDVSNTALTVLNPPSNDSVGSISARQVVERCYTLQEDIILVLTNEQISSGVWYIGLFNGFGSASTQSKMIIRGSDFSFSANISVEGCSTPAMWGQYCNQTVIPLFCSQSNVHTSTKNYFGADLYNQAAEIVTTCESTSEDLCITHKVPHGYSLDVIETVQQLKVMAVNVSFGEHSINSTGSASGTLYARYGAIPSDRLHDYHSDISQNPLVITSPKVGRWYISLLPDNLAEQAESKAIISDLCYSLDWQVQDCPVGKAGRNCMWNTYMLQTVIRKSLSFESYYWPMVEEISPSSMNFHLEPLLSNTSVEDTSEYAWTYFLLDIPRGAAGGSIYVQLNSDTKLDYEIYSRFGGLPSLDTWDYYYANKTSASNESVFFMLDDSSDTTISFYIVYAQEGTWGFGLRHPVHTGDSSRRQTRMVIASERCPKGCSSHGYCQNVLDASGLTFYSYCSCDRDHGGFDCSIGIVSHRGHIWQSIALISSNGAAILPAFWTLRQKAFAEWVLFTASGISSGLYHACDVGTWCALSFHVLQFMDFWLSFMAVVSTFVYLPNIDEVKKRLIHTVVAIVTALMAIRGATRSSNIILVIAIGASALVICWIIESSTTIRSLSFSTILNLDIRGRWQYIRHTLYNLMKTIRTRFRWWSVLIGFVLLSLAGLSWQLETDKSYWIWHSVWHVSIYTSSFFFLYSKVNPVDSSTQEDPNVAYELTQQDSSSRV